MSMILIPADLPIRPRRRGQEDWPSTMRRTRRAALRGETPHLIDTVQPEDLRAQAVAAVAAAKANGRWPEPDKRGNRRRAAENAAWGPILWGPALREAEEAVRGANWAVARVNEDQRLCRGYRREHVRIGNVLYTHEEEWSRRGECDYSVLRARELPGREPNPEEKP